MDRFEKIEQLRARADVSYEEAKTALEQANDDLVDAILILEKQGKIRNPQAEAEKAQTAEAAMKRSKLRKQQADEGDRTGKQKKEGSSFGDNVRKFFRFLRRTSFKINRRGENVAVMPSMVMAVVLLMFWQIVIPAALIALFFDFRYEFDGREDTKAANDILNKAGSFADGVESSLQKEYDENRQEETVKEKVAEFEAGIEKAQETVEQAVASAVNNDEATA